MKQIRVLMVIGALDYCNGITAYALNYYSHLDKAKYHFDFAVHYDFQTEFKDRLIEQGSKVMFMGNYSLKSMLGLSKRIRKVLQEGNYDIVHCHILNVAPFYFKQAKKLGIKVRIIHSHATKNSDNFLKNIRNSVFKKLALARATDRFACSRLAGDYLFRKDYKVIANAIDYSRFSYKEASREELLKKYNLDPKALVLGFVGRFTEQKNIPFLLEVLSALSKNNVVNFHAFIIGDGHLEPFIRDYVKNHDLSDRVSVVPAIPDISGYYSLFDILMLPSFFEGLPVTGVEAQVAGCEVFCSDAVSDELNFAGKCRYLPIASIEPWVSAVESFERPAQRECLAMDYDINEQARRLDTIYTELAERSHEA